MKSKISYKTLLNLILTLFPLLIVIVLFPNLPKKVPVHYNFSGEIDRWGSRYECFTLPIITIIFALILQLLKFTKNKVANAKPYYAMSLALLFIFNVFNFIFLYDCFYPKGFGTANLTSAALSFLFIVLGNFLPKLKQNNLIGIRLSWTLNNETVWYKTHRLGGIVWVIGGSIMLPSCLFVSNVYSTIILLAGLAIISIIPSVYSYVIYKKLCNNPNDSNTHKSV